MPASLGRADHDPALAGAAKQVQILRSEKGAGWARDVGPRFVAAVVESDAWREYYWPNPTGPDVVRWNTFEEFVTGSALKGGLHTTMKAMRELVRGNVQAEDALDRVTRRPHGKTRGDVTNGDKLQRPRGNGVARALRVLRDKAPELHAKVLAGELTANAAMIQGGFRKKTKQIPVDVEGAARVLKKTFSKAELRRLVKLLKASL